MTETKGHRHYVQFYEKDEYLITSLVEYLVPGFEQGDTAVIIATPEHRQALARRLHESGAHPENLELKGRLLLLDARETLGRFMGQDTPDPERFRAVFREILEKCGHPAHPIRAFGEMVALLWADGKEDAAVRLEEIWEQALHEAPFSLYCAYPIKDMRGASRMRAFRDVCKLHSRVIPSESYSAGDLSEDDRLRVVAELQQRAATLQDQAREKERLIEDMRNLHDLSFRLSRFTHLDQTLQAILRHALGVYQTQKGLLWVPAADGSGQRVAASAGFPPEFLRTVEDGPTGKGAKVFYQQVKDPIIVEDIEAEAVPEGFREAARLGGFRAVHSLPLISREGDLLGLLSVHFADRHPPSDRDLKFGEMYCRLAADAIDQARLRMELLQELARRVDAEARHQEQAATLEVLNRTAGKLSNEHNLEVIVQAVTDGGREVTRAAFGAFFYNRVNEKGETYQLYTLSGVPREAFAAFPIPRNTPIFAPTFEGKGTVRMDDVLKSPHYGKMPPHHGMPKGHLPVRSYLAVPVHSRTGEVLGGLFYGHPEPGVFKEQDERNLESLAAHAAVAIDNASLYEKLQAQLEQGRAREAAARHFASIVESSNDAIISKNLNSIVTSWNKSAERIFGYTAEEMIGTSITRLFPENHLDEEPEILRKIQSGGTITHYETIRRRKDGTLIDISLTVSPIKDESGNIIGASKIARDITDLKLAEDQLRQAQKMEAVGRLAGGVAHDFNNLLTSILGFVDMAMSEVAPDTLVAEYLDEVRKAGTRASTLTHQLLAYSRKQIMAPKVVDLNESVAEMDKMLRRLIGEDVDFRILLDPGLSPVKADPGQLQQIIMNLALNARDAMPEGGSLRVETDNVYLDRDYVANHPDATQGPHVQLMVSDTGSGMPPEVMAHIFEPFYTTKDVGKGTGLGLSSVYGIVRQSGGSIDVSSEVGKGSTFRIYLPAVDRKGHQAKDAPGPKPEIASLKGETILLAEDEPTVRKFLMAALKTHGYRVVEAKDGVDALALGRKLERIDLLLTDVVMPNLGGGKLVDELRKLHPSLKSLFISGYTKDSVTLKDMGEGETFLQKPFTQGDILAKVKEALSDREPD